LRGVGSAFKTTGLLPTSFSCHGGQLEWQLVGFEHVLLLHLTVLLPSISTAWLTCLLLHARRCHMVLGYVVPRSQVAFTPPTQEGAQLAWAYAGAAEYLVYGLK
jgi:hypothetical protein